MGSLILPSIGNSTTLMPSCKWREQNGVICFTVTSDGWTGEDLIRHLESNFPHVNNRVKGVLRSLDFKPTFGVTTKIVVLKGTLFPKKERTEGKIRVEAYRRNLIMPNAEVAHLVYKMFTDEQAKAMNLWQIVAMHKPINDFDGDPRLLGASRRDYCSWLDAFHVSPYTGWPEDTGFAFVSPNVWPFAPSYCDLVQ